MNRNSGKPLNIIESLLEGSPTEWAGFLIGLVVLSVLVWLLLRWVARMRDDDDPAVSEHQMLTQIGELHREGDLDENEYRSIKERLVDRLQDLDVQEPDTESKFDG